MKAKLLRWLAYLGFSLILSYPLIRCAVDHCWGSQWDLWCNLWLFAYFKQQLAQGQLLLMVTQLYYPFGLNLWFMGHFLVPLLAVPLQYLVSLPLSYNILVLVFISTNAWALSLLLEYLTASKPAAFLGGLLFVFNTFVFAHLQAGSGESLCWAWIPLMMLSACKFKDSLKLSSAAAAAGFLLLAFLTNWFYGALAGLWLAGFTLYHFVGREVQAKARFAAFMLLACLACLAVLAPLILALRHNYGAIFTSSLDPRWLTPEAEAQYHDFNSGRLALAEFTPADIECYNTWELVYSSLSLKAFIDPRAPLEPGWSVPGVILWLLGLGGFLLAGGNPKLKYWAWSGAGFTLLSLGVFLRWEQGPPFVNGKPLLIPLPFYFLYTYVPIFHTLARPERLIIMLSLSLMVAAGFGFAWMFARVSGGRARLLFLLLLGLIMLEVGLYRMGGRYASALTRVHTPAVYRWLSTQPGDRAVLEVPFKPLPLTTRLAQYQYYQAAHRHKTLNAFLIRSFQWGPLSQWARRNAFISLCAEDCSPPERFTLRLQDLAELRALKFKYLLLHTQFRLDPYIDSSPGAVRYFPDEALIRYLDRIFGPPRVWPEGILVYDLDRLNPGLKLGPGRAAYLQARSSAVTCYTSAGLPCTQPVKTGKAIRLNFDLRGAKFSRLAFYLKTLQPHGPVTVQLFTPGGKRLPADVAEFTPAETGVWQRVTLELSAPAELGSLRLESATPLKLVIREVQALP